MAKHHPDLIFCRKQAGVGKLKNFFYMVKKDSLFAFQTFKIV
jgi:hypothetical protein